MVGTEQDWALNAFPPEDLRGFLQLCAGDWLTLRSLLETDPTDDGGSRQDSDPLLSESQSWHQADRGELTIAFIEAQDPRESGGLDVGLPSGRHVRLVFRVDGSLVLSEGVGCWRLAPDGTLELGMETHGALVKERIWFSKPNLRLRCTLEQRRDGSPGRASFCSEIRRVKRPADAVASSPT